MGDDDDLVYTVSYKPGDLLKEGQYKIIDEIGEGGFGKVYLAEDLKKKTKSKFFILILKILFNLSQISSILF